MQRTERIEDLPENIDRLVFGDVTPRDQQVE
jgi:hypothetical protein